MIPYDGLLFEKLYDGEVAYFTNIRAVCHDDVLGALLLRDEGYTDVLRLLHQQQIHVSRSVGDDDKAADLRFKIAGPDDDPAIPHTD